MPAAASGCVRTTVSRAGRPPAGETSVCRQPNGCGAAQARHQHVPPLLTATPLPPRALLVASNDLSTTTTLWAPATVIVAPAPALMPRHVAETALGLGSCAQLSSTLLVARPRVCSANRACAAVRSCEDVTGLAVLRWRTVVSSPTSSIAHSLRHDFRIAVRSQPATTHITLWQERTDPLRREASQPTDVKAVLSEVRRIVATIRSDTVPRQAHTETAGPACPQTGPSWCAGTDALDSHVRSIAAGVDAALPP